MTEDARRGLNLYRSIKVGQSFMPRFASRYMMPEKRRIKMASNNSTRQLVPEAKEALDKFKMEAASEVGVNLKDGYNGDLTSREAGSVGGGMVKNMIKAYEQSLASQK